MASKLVLPLLLLHLLQASVLCLSYIRGYCNCIVDSRDDSKVRCNNCDSIPSLDNRADVVTLDLSGNRITKINAIPFPYLESLDLSQNLISDVKDDVMEEMDFLTGVSLAHNMIGEIGELTLSGMGKAEVLDLSYNHISGIRDRAFHDCGSLEHLNLSYNQIPEITEMKLDGLDFIESLNLSHNLLM